MTGKSKPDACPRGGLDFVQLCLSCLPLEILLHIGGVNNSRCNTRSRYYPDRQEQGETSKQQAVRRCRRDNAANGENGD